MIVATRTTKNMARVDRADLPQEKNTRSTQIVGLAGLASAHRTGCLVKDRFSIRGLPVTSVGRQPSPFLPDRTEQ